MSRQTERRDNFDYRFGKAKMDGKQKHSHRQTIGFNAAGKRIYAPRVVDFENRPERRKAARAFAAGDWNKRKAVA